MYTDATHMLHTCMISFVFSVLQADADEMQPQRLTSPELAGQDHPLFHSSRGFRQSWDPLTALVLRTTDEMGGTATVP